MSSYVYLQNCSLWQSQKCRSSFVEVQVDPIILKYMCETPGRTRNAGVCDVTGMK
jgi:hypothetical protein